MLQIFEYLYHMTHYNNLSRILEFGILSDELIRQEGIAINDISDHEVQERRENLEERIYGRRIHEYAAFYVNPRNPMLFRRREIQAHIVILAISKNVLHNHEHVFTDGNAASSATLFSASSSVLKNAEEVLLGDYWTDYEDGKRRRCAEVLVYPSVEPEFIDHIICRNVAVKRHLESQTTLPVIVSPRVYF